MAQIVDPLFVALVNVRGYAALQTSRRNAANTAYEWGTAAWVDKAQTFTPLQTFEAGLDIAANQRLSFSGDSVAGITLDSGQLYLRATTSSNIVRVGSPGNTVQLHVSGEVAGGDSVIKMGTIVGSTIYNYRIVAQWPGANWLFMSDDQVTRLALTPTGGPEFQNTSSSAPVVFRKSGGVSGTDEGVMYHDGTDLHIKNKDDSLGGTVNFNAGRVKLGTTAGTSAAAVEVVVTKYLTAPGELRMRTDDGSFAGGATGSLSLNPASDSGFTSMVMYNSTGAILSFQSQNGETQYGEIRATSSGMTLTNFYPGTIYGGSGVGSTLTLTGTSNGLPVNAHILLNPANQGRVGINTTTPTDRLSMKSVRYTDTEGMLLYTSDGSGYATGTGSLRLHPAFSSGFGGLQFLNNDGSRLEGYNSDGSLLYGRVDFSTAGVTITSGATTYKQLTLKATASQTANIEEWQKSDGTVYGSISENGYFTTRKNAAPADAELAAGEMAMWFDSTNGASKAMFKGKSANGTVVTGSVTLS